MALRVLIVPDKFKGTLTAGQAADAIAQGWRRVRPDDHLELLPMSDGGDGFGPVLQSLLGAESRTSTTVDASHRPRLAQWWWQSADRKAIIESAQVIGLSLLPENEFHPFELDSYGLGALIHDAIQADAGQCLMGIGGSATNDAGFGLARALGWTFLDNKSNPINRWTDLIELERLAPPNNLSAFPSTTVAVDVQNPLLGTHGASRVYGPQKGLREEDMPLAEACHEQLARVVEEQLGTPVHAEAGAGAAGGLGFGLRAFLNAQLRSGFDLFSQYAQLEQRIARADLVLTAEGAIDASSLMGKGVGGVLELCQRQNKPCVGLAGGLFDTALNNPAAPQFTGVYAIAPMLASVEEARRRADYWLVELAAFAAKESSRHAGSAR